MTSETQRVAGDGNVQGGRKGSARALVLPQTLTVKNLAELVDESAVDVIKQLMRNGIMVGMNQVIDHNVAALVTAAYGIRARVISDEEEVGPLSSAAELDLDSLDLVSRPPVVTILGHVDHGKTSLLDAIRQANVADKEIGGITQHMAAYQIETAGQKITFLDTPGHEAFTAIRSRGARVTDIAILVVAADDGIMPQTLEAINHAKAADVPIVVAINKMDLPGADPERVKRQLSEQNLLVEDWGGDVISVPVSARTGDGMQDLLDNILLVSEIAELKADPNKSASGVIIEARLDRKRGPTTTVLIQGGTLNIGDFVVAGSAWGRVKALTNDRGDIIKTVVPGTPVEMLGFGSLPEAGDMFSVVGNERLARTTANERRQSKAIQLNQARALTLDQVVNQIDSGDVKELILIYNLVQAEVREIFPSRRNVQIAGCRVVEGRITRGGVIRVIRNSETLMESSIVSLRHFRDEVNEINTGVECGIMLQGFNDYEIGDLLEVHRQERNPI